MELKSPAAVLKNDETVSLIRIFKKRWQSLFLILNKQVEWMVCAKYTHGGAVKGVVKSNFRFVFEISIMSKFVLN